MKKPVVGFSKLSKTEKIDWLIANYFEHNLHAKEIITNYWHSDLKLQQLHDEFIENTITNYYLPFGVAPNFLINGKLRTIPMAIEESSVVAAASKAAKFWLNRGGFKTSVISTKKVGQVHFIFKGNQAKLLHFFQQIKQRFFEDAATITKNMERRGGGILDIELIDKQDDLAHYFQLHCE